MAAKTRWVGYATTAVGRATDGGGNGCKGTTGYCRATANVGDTFSIGPTTNRLYVSIDGESAPYITLYSGANLDPRFLARDITEKLHDLGKTDDRWNAAKCIWTNDKTVGNCFEIHSGTLGSSSSVIVTTTGTNSAAATLGFTTSVANGGVASLNGFSGDVTISGTYNGFLDETYRIVITNDTYGEAVSAPRGIGAAVKYVANTYDGTFTTGGVFRYSADITYTIAIDVTNGTTVGGGTGNVPRMSWLSTGNDSSTTATELLYADHWFKVGDYGLMVKFTDAVFNQVSPAWSIECKKADYVGGTNASAPVGIAQYVYASDRGDFSSAPITTASGNFTALGHRGLSIRFNPSNEFDSFNAGDEFYVICNAPKPASYNLSSINYGNVTVSTESPVKCVVFEVESGAVELSTVRFGLQSKGTFQHHYAGNNDTKFRFGTVGPARPAGVNPNNGIEWWPNVVPGDIDDNIPPAYLFSTKANLPVVSTADDSETIGNKGLMSDPIFINIKLGTSEVGSNSSINMRIFFDYS